MPQARLNLARLTVERVMNAMALIWWGIHVSYIFVMQGICLEGTDTLVVLSRYVFLNVLQLNSTVKHALKTNYFN